MSAGAGPGPVQERDGWLSTLVPSVRRTPRLADALTAAVIAGVGTVLVALDLFTLSSDLSTGLDVSRWWHLLPLAIGCAVLLGKRRHPVPALAAGAVVVLTETALLGLGIGTYLVLADLLFAAETFAGERARRGVRVVVAVLALASAGLAAVITGDPRVVAVVLVQAVVSLGVPLWWARDLRRSAEVASLERQRAELQRTRDHDALRLVALDRDRVLRDERAATARDLHDVVTSHLAAVAIHAAAGMADGADDRSALRQVRTSSLAALEEMRRMIGLLRSERPPGTAAAPGLDRLDRLVDGARAAGLSVRLDVPVEADGAIPPGVDQAAYRIVGEALVNAAKHAPGGTVRLHVDTRDPLRLLVHSRSAPHAAAARVQWPESAGQGLASMTERAHAVGGDLTAGPLPDGSWRVEATLPHSAGRGGS